MTTRRERMEARLERRREWAEGRDQKAAERTAAAEQVADMIPLGQPMLIGHHSYRADANRRNRMQTNFSKAVEHANMADKHRSKAEGIARQLDTSVFSDDADADERLTKRVQALEAQRARVKAFNAAVRKGKGDQAVIAEALLTLEPAEQKQYLSAAVNAPLIGKYGTFPTYYLSNLTAKIARNRKRLAELRSMS